MATTFNPDDVKLTPHSLSDYDLYWIGRLVRATANLEDIVNWHLHRLTNVSYDTLAKLLGKMSVNGRIALAKSFATFHGGNAKKFHDDTFETELFEMMIHCRNCVVHSVLLGITESGHLAFRANDTLAPDEQGIPFKVTTFKPEWIKLCAEYAEELIPIVEKTLKLEELRTGRSERGLVPRPPKARGKPQREQKPPPQSSEA